MSKDKNRAEVIARRFLEKQLGIRPYFMSLQHTLRACFTVNREGFPSEHRKEVQWLLEHRWVRRERSGPLMMARKTEKRQQWINSNGTTTSIAIRSSTKRFTQMVLTQKGMNVLGIVDTPKGYKLKEKQR